VGIRHLKLLKSGCAAVRLNNGYANLRLKMTLQQLNTFLFIARTAF
jgi:hypothetical protein